MATKKPTSKGKALGKVKTLTPVRNLRNTKNLQIRALKRGPTF